MAPQPNPQRFSCPQSLPPPHTTPQLINKITYIPSARRTPELHDRFVAAVNRAGGPFVAKPKQIEIQMNVHGLHLAQIKSHLQKYRLKLTKDGAAGHYDGKSEPSGQTWAAPPPAADTAPFHPPPKPAVSAPTLGPPMPPATLEDFGAAQVPPEACIWHLSRGGFKEGAAPAWGTPWENGTPVPSPPPGPLSSAHLSVPMPTAANAPRVMPGAAFHSGPQRPAVHAAHPAQVLQAFPGFEAKGGQSHPPPEMVAAAAQMSPNAALHGALHAAVSTVKELVQLLTEHAAMQQRLAGVSQKAVAQLQMLMAILAPQPGYFPSEQVVDVRNNAQSAVATQPVYSAAAAPAEVPRPAGPGAGAHADGQGGLHGGSPRAGDAEALEVLTMLLGMARRGSGEPRQQQQQQQGDRRHRQTPPGKR